MDLTFQRRHTKTCPDKDKGPHHLKCRGRRPCPLWAHGYDDNGNRIRESLKTRDVQRAGERLTKLIARLRQEPTAPKAPRKTIAEAAEAFHERHKGKAIETKRLYKRYIGRIADYLDTAGVQYVQDMKLETFDSYLAQNEKPTHTWRKNLEILKAFIKFCMDRKWCELIDLRAIRAQQLEEQNDIVPYTTEEMDRIVQMCGFLKSEYQRRRALAAALLMRYTGVRVSDVVTLERGHLQGARLIKRAHKNRKWIRITLPNDLLDALQRLPRPIGAPTDSPYFFVSGNATVRSSVTSMERLFAAVNDLAKVPGAHPHRFRHTVATKLLGKGRGVDEVAEYLADSPATIRKHYAKWTQERQVRQDSMLLDIHDTNLAQAEGTMKSC